MATVVQTGDKYAAAAWQIGAAVVAAIVAGVFWLAVAFTTVTAIVWVVSIIREVAISPGWYTIPVGFSIIEMAIYKRGSNIGVQAYKLGRTITAFDMATTMFGIALVIWYSEKLAPYWAAYQYGMYPGMLLVAGVGGWIMTLWPERLMVDAFWSIVDAVKTLVK